MQFGTIFSAGFLSIAALLGAASAIANPTGGLVDRARAGDNRAAKLTFQNMKCDQKCGYCWPDRHCPAFTNPPTTDPKARSSLSTLVCLCKTKFPTRPLIHKQKITCCDIGIEWDANNKVIQAFNAQRGNLVTLASAPTPGGTA